MIAFKRSALIFLAIFSISLPAFGQGNYFLPSLEARLTRTLIMPENYNGHVLIGEEFRWLSLNLYFAGLAGIMGRYNPDMDDISLKGLPFVKEFKAMGMDSKFSWDNFGDVRKLPPDMLELKANLISGVGLMSQLIFDEQMNIFPVNMDRPAKAAFYTAAIATLFRTRNFILEKFLSDNPHTVSGSKTPGGARPGTIDRRALHAYYLMTKMIDPPLAPEAHYDYFGHGKIEPSDYFADTERFKMDLLDSWVRAMVLEDKNAVSRTMNYLYMLNELDIVAIHRSLGDEPAKEDMRLLQEIYESYKTGARRFGLATGETQFPDNVEEFVNPVGMPGAGGVLEYD